MDAARSGTRILWTPRELSLTGRDVLTPRDVKTAVVTARLTPSSQIFDSTYDSPTRTGTQYFVSPRRSIGPQKFRNAHPFKTSINLFSPKHRHPTPIFSKLIGRKIFLDEIVDVYTCKSIDFRSNSVVAKSPNFMPFRLRPANTADKLNSVIVPTTRVGRLTDLSKCLVSRQDIEEVAVERVSEAKVYSNYIFEN